MAYPNPSDEIRCLVEMLQDSDGGCCKESYRDEYDDGFSSLDATCLNCDKTEAISLFEDIERGSLSGLYFCKSCETELTLINYFSTLQSKGILNDYADWIVQTYPEYKKFVFMDYEFYSKRLELFKEFIEGEKLRDSVF